MLATIQPGDSFKANLQLLPPIDAIQQIDLVDGDGTTVHSIANAPGKQGSLAVYNYLQQAFGTLDAKAAEHGLIIFAEHVPDAKANPGAHPNVDYLLAIAADGAPLSIKVVTA